MASFQQWLILSWLFGETKFKIRRNFVGPKMPSGPSICAPPILTSSNTRLDSDVLNSTPSWCFLVAITHLYWWSCPPLRPSEKLDAREGDRVGFIPITCHLVPFRVAFYPLRLIASTSQTASHSVFQSLLMNVSDGGGEPAKDGREKEKNWKKKKRKKRRRMKKKEKKKKLWGKKVAVI